MYAKFRKSDLAPLGPASRRVYPGGIRVNSALRLNHQIGAVAGESTNGAGLKLSIGSAFVPETVGINPAARWGDARRARGGFTLVELLMVITIIAVLMTLTVSVIGAFLSQAKETATTTTLSKIQGLADSRQRALDRLIQRKGFFTGSFEYRFVSINFPSSTVKPVTSKLLQMKYFPQSAADLNFLMNVVYQNNSAAQSQFVNMYPKLFLPTNQPLPNLTNSEILYNVLTENVVGDSPLAPDAFSSSEVITEPPNATMKTAGLPYFVDAWKHPIRFYRWPTRLFCSSGTPGTISATDVMNAKLVFSSLPVFTGNLQNDLARDPDDPLRSCMSIPNFEALVVNNQKLSAFHTPATYHIPIFVSAGPDGFLGLAEPDAPDVTGPPAVLGRLASLNVTPTHPLAQAQDELNDNIVSASIKAGGK